MTVRSKINIHIKAPGRICLFGDHQDYLGLPVIACAINRYIRLKATLNTDNSFRIVMPDINQERVINLYTDFITEGKRDYFVSSLHVLRKYGITPDKGYDIRISGDIPVNAGLSSSSAIVVAWIRFLLEAFSDSDTISQVYIGRLAYEAEVLEYNSPGGLMDQYTISLGNLVYLNTVTGDHKKINKNLRSFIIGESGIPKKTLGVLSQLRGMALDAIAEVSKKTGSFKIENAIMEDYYIYEKHVSKNLRPIFYAAIKNYEITKSALLAFSQEKIDLDLIGSLMSEHHNVLKDILKITVPKIDTMIDASLASGALGAKIVGSGGGGCIVALAKPELEGDVIKAMLHAGAKNAYKINIVNGVHTVED